MADFANPAVPQRSTSKNKTAQQGIESFADYISVHASLFGYIQEFEFVTASPSGIVGALCRLSISTRIRYDIKRSVTNQK